MVLEGVVVLRSITIDYRQMQLICEYSHDGTTHRIHMPIEPIKEPTVHYSNTGIEFTLSAFGMLNTILLARIRKLDE